MDRKPSFSEFVSMAKQGNLIPIYREILGDTETPVSAYLKIRNASFSYLLESAENSETLGRYSYIGYKPFLVVVSRNNEMEIWEGEQKSTLRDVQNPLHVLRALNARLKPVMSQDLPPFQGGLVGYVNYDLARKWERLPGIRPANRDLPEAMFIATRRLVIFDHLTHRIKVVVFAQVQDESDLQRVFTKACQEMEETFDDLHRPIPNPPTTHSMSLSELKSNVKKDEFETMVRRAKEHIVSGDVIQVVLSQEFSGTLSGEDYDLYRTLRSVNPSPYMFYVDFGEVKLIGASPEVLVRLTNGTIELIPIAGTKPRGETEVADKALEEDLLSDPKERAEHIMLVDLGRNDVGKVSEPGSVTVPRLMDVERFSHVMHIVSYVKGSLRKGMDCFDLFMSAFPAGTVTGAPKIRAMEIISELEPTQRGAYAGAVGYFGFNGNMDFCITIRTITISGDKLAVQVGAGIVADSDPEAEYNETLKKAAAMLEAIEEVKANDTRHRQL